MFYSSTLNFSDFLSDVNKSNFDEMALSIFNYQYNNNDIYNQYCTAIKKSPQNVNSVTEIPYLPISFFKSHRVVTGEIKQNCIVFESSGTTAEIPSKHFVCNHNLYENSLISGFEKFYGSPTDYVFLALLPSYLERKNASLVYMANTLIKKSSSKDNGFYINEWGKLSSILEQMQKTNQKTLLLGVTFALLDFAEQYTLDLSNIIVMETGGMKGRREEMTRQEIHTILKKQFNLKQVHSEYGMTEMLSQAYSIADGIYNCTNTLKVLIRDINDPFEIKTIGSGCINIIDLANINSCCFIATEDIGTVYSDFSFEVKGRIDHAALRGCSLMMA